ncbi:plasmid recombination protein [Sporolactobacillus pectinivorans]|uniref:plasmid recombination protein n=1 Tax=Sporolactobacillus pectinivorans TaxID=1591408 RepID=UPI00196118A6|nr:plasmid recombination protein [Sporolactobacillus pectinivorans]
MPKIDRSIVRNEAYRKTAVGIRERHNERKNQEYSNPDIVKDRSYLNIHFKSCDGSYAETFDRMLADGTISKRGLQPDAKVIDELIFDVNTAYFYRNGGYEYAKEFFCGSLPSGGQGGRRRTVHIISRHARRRAQPSPVGTVWPGRVSLPYARRIYPHCG